MPRTKRTLGFGINRFGLDTRTARQFEGDLVDRLRGNAIRGKGKTTLAKPTFFKAPDAFRTWLEKNHDRETELLVGFYKRDSGTPSITWPESVDEALCFGWIDGVRKSLGETSYTIRFTPRKAKSTWSAVNIKRAQDLLAAGRMQPAGLTAFEARDEARSRVYSFEQKNVKLSDEFETAFKANKKAWAYFQSQPPWYRRTASWWVISAKKEETRLRRLSTLIEDSAQGRRIAAIPKAK